MAVFVSEQTRQWHGTSVVHGRHVLQMPPTPLPPIDTPYHRMSQPATGSPTQPWGSGPHSIKRHGTTLATCDSEPVQTPGCIQAHGALLANALKYKRPAEAHRCQRCDRPTQGARCQCKARHL
jgi:hypothetical protein